MKKWKAIRENVLGIYTDPVSVQRMGIKFGIIAILMVYFGVVSPYLNPTALQQAQRANGSAKHNTTPIYSNVPAIAKQP